MKGKQYEKMISGKKFVLASEYPTKRGAQRFAAQIRREVFHKGYLVRVVQTPRWHTYDPHTGITEHFWGVYVYDGIKKPWKVPRL